MELREKYEKLESCKKDELLTGLVNYYVTDGNADKLIRLLTNFDYIDIKLSNRGLEDLISDYSLITSPEFETTHTNENPDLRQLDLVASTLRNASDILKRDPSQLSTQLWAFLRPDNGPKNQKLLLAAQSQQNDTPWFKPITGKTTRADGPSEWVMNASEGTARCVMAHPDNRHFLVGYSNGTLILWNADNNSVTWRTSQPTVVIDMLITRNGETAITASKDEKIRVWDVETGELIHCLWLDPANTPAFRRCQANNVKNEVKAIAFYRSEGNIIAGYVDGSYIVWNIEDGMPVSPRTFFLDFLEHSQITHIISWSGANYDSFYITHEIWSDADAAQQRKLYDIYCATFSYDIDANNKIHMMQYGGTSPVEDIAVTDDGEVIMIVSRRNVRILDDRQPDGKITERFLEFSQTVSVAISPDKRLFALGFSEGVIKIYELSSLQEFATYEGHQGSVYDLTFSNDSERLVSVGWEGSVRVWIIAVNHSQQVSTFHENRVLTALAVTPDGSEVLSGFGSDSGASTVVVRNVTTQTPLETIRYLGVDGRGGGEINAFSVTSDSKYFVMASDREHCFSIWDLAQRHHLYSSHVLGDDRNHQYPISCLTISQNERYIVTGSEDCDLKLWRLSQKKLFGLLGEEKLQCDLVETFSGHEDAINAVVTTFNNRCIISCSDRQVIAWDLQRRQKTREYEMVHGGSAIALFKDGRHFLLGDPRVGCVFVVNIDDPRIVPPQGSENDWHPNKIRNVFILPEQRYVVSVGLIMVKLWDLQNRSLVCSLTLDSVAHSSALTPDGKILIVGDQLGVVNFIAIERGNDPLQPVARNPRPKPRVPPPILRQR